MTTLQKIKSLAALLLVLFFCSCERKYDFTLPGKISGTVKDAVTQESVKHAVVNIYPADGPKRSDTTGIEGTFLFTDLEPSVYLIEVQKYMYITYTDNIDLSAASTDDREIMLNGRAEQALSTSCLHFGLESTQLSFSISNIGGGILSYDIIPSRDWISVSSESGEIKQDPMQIEVNILKGGLPERSHHGWIEIHSDPLGEARIDTIDVYVNYLMDEDSILYKTVRIGTQVWMAENLNTGTMVDDSGEEFPTRNNDIIEKLCYDNDSMNCETYGGLYMWKEAMDYAPADTLSNSTTRGICPEGWHIPTPQDWETLITELGADMAGGMLKDTSDLWWSDEHAGASNETGFSALPAGVYQYQTYIYREKFMNMGKKAYFWTTYYDASETWRTYQLLYNDTRLLMGEFSDRLFYPNAMSVRCVKDP